MTRLSGKDKSVFVRSMFDSIAPRYDLMNAVMTFGQHQNMRRAAPSWLSRRAIA
jgi:ubiquinone/menaquinone biosynthesis C-methylase UbiE